MYLSSVLAFWKLCMWHFQYSAAGKSKRGNRTQHTHKSVGLESSRPPWPFGPCRMMPPLAGLHRNPTSWGLFWLQQSVELRPSGRWSRVGCSVTAVPHQGLSVFLSHDKSPVRNLLQPAASPNAGLSRWVVDAMQQAFFPLGGISAKWPNMMFYRWNFYWFRHSISPK